MKKILLSILFAFCFFISFGQNIINRSNSSVTASDARLQAALNLYVPRFVDTTAANLSIGLDSCGAVIFTYNVNWYWIRQCSPKRWSMLPTVNGSLVSNVYIVDSNHIAICNINSCDTIQINGIQGPITNITIINNTSIRVCGSDILGTEQISNGAFAGSAAGWTLGVLWAYGSNDISHSFGSTASSFQGGGLVEGGSYFVELDITGGTVGTVAVSLDAGTSQTYGPAAGSVSFTGTWNAGINSKINLVPTNDFDGNITNVSVKQLLPNCDTLQIVPTNFTDSVRIYVVTPLHALNDSTFYISQAGPTIRGGDSGYLSTAGYDTFLNKVDSNTHSAQNNIDFLQFVKNGVVTNWDTVHVNCYGLDEPGQVAWSGFGLGYIVNSAFYHLNCKPYISPSTLLTLDDADATNPRIDLIYVDSSGNSGVLTGTPEANPVKPQIDPFWQLELTTILVPALATVAPIDTAVIYNENVAAPDEWTPITNAGTTTDPDNTLNVYRGAKSLNITNITPGDSIIFTPSSTIDISVYSAVVLFIKLKEVVPAASQLRIGWFNGSTLLGSSVSLGFDHNNTSTYQNISVPLSYFGSITNVTSMKMSWNSSVSTPNLGFFLDFIYLQDGVGPVVPSNTLVAYNGLTKTNVNGIDSVKWSGTLNQNTTIAGAGFYTAISGGRFEIAKGANVVAANNLTLGADGNLFTITGNTQINAITTANWQAGSVLTMIFTGTPTVKNNTAGGAGTATFILAGATDFVAAANDLLTVIYDGTNWYEQSRKITSSSGAYTASNGLTMTANNTVLGGSLTGNTTIAGSGFQLTITGNSGTKPLAVINNAGAASFTSTTGIGGSGVATTSGIGLQGSSGSGSGVVAFSTSGTALSVQSTSGIGADISVNPSSTNTVVTIATLDRVTSGTPANGIGGSLDFLMQNSVIQQTTNQIISKLTDVTQATRTSQMIITGVLSATTVNLMTLNANGSIQLRPITATAASAITPAEGMIVFVSDTNGTFLSIGYWGYRNGAWAAF